MQRKINQMSIKRSSVVGRKLNCPSTKEQFTISAWTLDKFPSIRMSNSYLKIDGTFSDFYSTFNIFDFIKKNLNEEKKNCSAKKKRMCAKFDGIIILCESWLNDFSHRKNRKIKIKNWHENQRKCSPIHSNFNKLFKMKCIKYSKLNNYNYHRNYFHLIFPSKKKFSFLLCFFVYSLIFCCFKNKIIIVLNFDQMKVKMIQSSWNQHVNCSQFHSNSDHLTNFGFVCFCFFFSIRFDFLSNLNTLVAIVMD